MTKKCLECGAKIPDTKFDDSDRICGGKNEKCDKCGAVLWIEFEKMFVLSPVIMLATN